MLVLDNVHVKTTQELTIQVQHKRKIKWR